MFIKYIIEGNAKNVHTHIHIHRQGNRWWKSTDGRDDVHIVGRISFDVNMLTCKGWMQNIDKREYVGRK